MGRGGSEQVTALLRAWSGGNSGAAEKLIPLVYDELRLLAQRHLRRERGDHTLRPTALVHEAFLKMVDQREGALRNRNQFFALAAQAMRRVLVDHARAHVAAKRAGGWERVTLAEDAAAEPPRELDVIALDRALEELRAIDPEKMRLVELRFFGGLSVDEAAEVLGMSAATAARQWRLVRAWLFRRLEDSVET